jgi:caa(3)-type oxidase subunit IV
MAALVRTKASVAWLVLVALTSLSWALGTDHGLTAAAHVGASVVIIAIAVCKVRLVGLYFMELNAAPALLRGLFEGYCAVLLGLLVTFFLFV